jgi:hypothetical protein
VRFFACIHGRNFTLREGRWERPARGAKGLYVASGSALKYGKTHGTFSPWVRIISPYSESCAVTATARPLKEKKSNAMHSTYERRNILRLEIVPKRPVPSSIRVVGSGTAAAGVSPINSCGRDAVVLVQLAFRQ